MHHVPFLRTVLIVTLTNLFPRHHNGPPILLPNGVNPPSTLIMMIPPPPFKHSVISLEAGDVDGFDESAQQLTAMPVPPQSSSPTLPTGTPVDSFYNKYMEEYQPDSLVGPAVGDDLARTVNIFFEKKLSYEKLKERRLREMRSENINLMMRTTNNTRGCESCS